MTHEGAIGYLRVDKRASGTRCVWPGCQRPGELRVITPNGRKPTKVHLCVEHSPLVMGDGCVVPRGGKEVKP